MGDVCLVEAPADLGLGQPEPREVAARSELTDGRLVEA
jgi:hypothetical protein